MKTDSQGVSEISMYANSTMAKTHELNTGTFTKTSAYQSEMKLLEPIQEEHEQKMQSSMISQQKTTTKEETFKKNNLQIVVNDEP